MKKVLLAIGAVFIMLSMATIMPVVASEQSHAIAPSYKSRDITLLEQEKQEITRIMMKYTEKTTDGLLKIKINDISSIPLSNEEIQLYEKGIEKLNELVSEGKIIIVKENGEYVGIQSKQKHDHHAWIKYHWWGWTLYLDEYATQLIIKTLVAGGAISGLVTAILAESGIGAGIAGIVTAALLAVAGILDWIDTMGHNRGIHINYCWWGSVWVWHN